ncbi:MAG: hypothetical protein ACYSTF_10135 [Planctomycetota bacterium]
MMEFNLCSLLITAAFVGLLGGLIVGATVGVLQGKDWATIKYYALMGATIGTVALPAITALAYLLFPSAVVAIASVPAIAQISAIITKVLGLLSFAKHTVAPIMFISTFALGSVVGFIVSADAQPPSLKEVVDRISIPGGIIAFSSAVILQHSTRVYSVLSSLGLNAVRHYAVRIAFPAIFGFAGGYAFGRIVGEAVFHRRLYGFD